MARLAYCKVCRATYPLIIVHNDGGRSGRVREPACPLGHTEVETVEAPHGSRGTK